MEEPRIVATKTARVPATARTAPSSRRGGPSGKMLPALWGVLFIVGGLVVWSSISRDDSGMPEVWRETADPAHPERHLVSATRASENPQGDLLRMEWPAHPQAQHYLVRFRDANGRGPAPVSVQGTVFLYDLNSDVLHLPSRFEWEVTAVLVDGSHVVTPSRRFPPEG